jgi:hypothetical protein
MFPMFFTPPAPPAMAPEMPMPAEAQPVSEGMAPMPGLPVNPMVGGEPQQPTLEPQLPMEAQQAGGMMPPVEPTKGI